MEECLLEEVFWPDARRHGARPVETLDSRQDRVCFPLLEVVWTDRAKAAWQRACFEANAHSRRERAGAHAAVPEVEFVLNPRSKKRLLSAQIAEQALQYLLVYPSTCLGKPTAASRSFSVPANDPSRRRGVARRALPVGLLPPRTRINDLTATC